MHVPISVVTRKRIGGHRVATAIVSFTLGCHAGANAAENWQIGAVLDVAQTSRSLALGGREQGLQLGHSDISAAGPLGQTLQARLSLAVHSDHGKIEADVEEAYLQTRSLPAGLQLRAGRFASQIGYLNEQHPHADDFAERPLLYRALLGGHWFDDGLRLNWTAPTPFYLRTGLEVFSGRQLLPEAPGARRAGAVALSAKIGHDWSASSSWQLGAAWLLNRRTAPLHRDETSEHHDHDEDHDDDHGQTHAEDHGHHHAHGAVFSGRHTTLLDATWKWSPGGNNREQQLKLVGEWAQVRGLNPHAQRSDRHIARSLMAVWRWSAAWESGIRFDALRARSPHEDHFHSVRLRERTLMLAYKPTHAQTVRLQWSQQHDAQGIEGAASRSLQLQYVLSFGAHGAHSF